MKLGVDDSAFSARAHIRKLGGIEEGQGTTSSFLGGQRTVVTTFASNGHPLAGADDDAEQGSSDSIHEFLNYLFRGKSNLTARSLGLSSRTLRRYTV